MEGTDSEVNTTYQYVLDLQNRLQETCEVAREQLEQAQGRQEILRCKGAREKVQDRRPSIVIVSNRCE